MTHWQSPVVRVEVPVEMTPRLVAEAFAEMNDEQQAQVFIEVAAIAAGWATESPCLTAPQWWMVGRHLRTCSCSTDEARQLVRDIAQGIGPEQ